VPILLAWGSVTWPPWQLFVCDVGHDSSGAANSIRRVRGMQGDGRFADPFLDLMNVPETGIHQPRMRRRQ